MNTMNKKKLPRIIALAIVVTALAVIMSLKHGFRITAYSPNLNKISTGTPYFDINFNNPLSTKGISISSPSGIINSYSIVGSSDLRIFFNLPLELNTSYKLVIGSISDRNGDEIRNESIVFKTVYLSPSTRTKQETQYIVSQQDKPNYQIYGTTLVNLLPFIGPANDFLINYGLVNNIPEIIITGTTQQSFNDAKIWISAQGYDITNLKIEYITGRP